VKIPLFWVVTRRPVGRSSSNREKPLVGSYCGFVPKSGHAVEHGVEQGAKARALVQAGKNRRGLLLENSVTDIVGSTFQERTHAFLGRLHMKLESEHALTHCKSLSLRYLALGEQH
jgi:hypothetical protein